MDTGRLLNAPDERGGQGGFTESDEDGVVAADRADGAVDRCGVDRAGQRLRARHRVMRRVLDEPVVYYDDLVERERECCPFLDIRVEPEGERLVVSIRGPSEAQPVLDAIYAAAAGEPAT